MTNEKNSNKNAGLELEVSQALVAHIPSIQDRQQLGEALDALCGKAKAGQSLATRANDILHRLARAANLARGIASGHHNVRLPGTRKAHVVAAIGAKIKKGASPANALAEYVREIGAPVEGLSDGAALSAARPSAQDIFG